MSNSQYVIVHNPQGREPPLMVNALVPEVRCKPCPHKAIAWSGSMPCTGNLRCFMCGCIFKPKMEN